MVTLCSWAVQELLYFLLHPTIEGLYFLFVPKDEVSFHHTIFHQDFFLYLSKATDRIIEALGLVDPSTDWVDGMTYTRIVKGADLDNLRKSSLAENDFGFTGFTASLLSPQNDL